MEILVIELVEVILERAEKEIDLLMPGYTHLQRGQVGETFYGMIGNFDEFLTEFDQFSLFDGAIGF